MGSRDTLHRLVDELAEEDIPTAERVLQALCETAAPHVPLDAAPFDDEPDDDDFDGGLTEARERKRLSDELIAERRGETRRS